jgi:hypothetical protein
MTTRRIVLIAMALLSALTVNACLFEAREADPPDSGSGPSVPLDSPTQPFVAIRASFEKDNDVDYERALSEDFRFYPLLDDSLDQSLIGTGAYDNWTKDVELEVVQLLLSESNLEVTFETTPLINENTFVRYEATYVLLVITPAVPPDTAQYAGTSQIDVRNEGGNWRFVNWRDISAGPGVRTWGYLRGITRLRLSP